MSDDLKARIDALADAIEQAFDGGLLPRYGLTAHQMLREARDRIEELERENADLASQVKDETDERWKLDDRLERAEAACREVIRLLGDETFATHDEILAAARAGLTETKP